MLSAALVVFALQPAGSRTGAYRWRRRWSARRRFRKPTSRRAWTRPSPRLWRRWQTRQDQQTRQILADLDESRRRLLVAAQEFDYDHRRDGASLISAGLMGPPRQGGTGEAK